MDDEIGESTERMWQA